MVCYRHIQKADSEAEFSIQGSEGGPTGSIPMERKRRKQVKGEAAEAVRGSGMQYK